MADEEQEDEVWESWEDVDTDELERRMEEREKLQVQHDLKMFDPGTKVLQEDSTRTQYVPQVRILKRQQVDQFSGEVSSNATLVANKPAPKTLAEREADYAAARARILGSPNDGEYESDVTIAGSETKHLQLDEKPQENVIRQPRGPDGSKGFSQVRP